MGNATRWLGVMTAAVCIASSSCASTQPADSADDSNQFSLSSPAFSNGGDLPAIYTCDGDSTSPPLQWSGEPLGTVGFAILMDHQPGPGDWHWYWTEWGIGPDVHSVAPGATVDGVFGTNSVNTDLAYAPPCSKGPGTKSYTITVFALSAQPELPDPRQVDRDTLLSALDAITLATDTLTITY
ncbi:MAG: YbhB/YbcL family Raf kinase inhibitor-like protein, partial [Acidimicrobiia bacterium]|nr:YbhB/YbcL family Raf kinase inhibitor-like protein [Acidimicrobiia bacterium]